MMRNQKLLFVTEQIFLLFSMIWKLPFNILPLRCLTKAEHRRSLKNLPLIFTIQNKKAF